MHRRWDHSSATHGSVRMGSEGRVRSRDRYLNDSRRAVPAMPPSPSSPAPPFFAMGPRLSLTRDWRASDSGAVLWALRRTTPFSYLGFQNSSVG